MNIFGTIKDTFSGEYLKGATIEVLTFDSKKTGQTIAANNMGSFAITVPPGSKLLVTHVGYKPTIADADFFDNGAFLDMEKAVTELDAVTVTAAKKKKSNILLYIVGGIIVTKLLKLW